MIIDDAARRPSAAAPAPADPTAIDHTRETITEPHKPAQRPRRNRASAKTVGTRFETSIAGYLAEHVDDRIERRAKTGAKDRGDISGVRAVHNARVVVECKDTTRTALAGWAAEVETERGNDDAEIGVIVHKRRGVGDPGQQWVTCTVDDLVALLTGSRPRLKFRDGGAA